MRSRIPSTAAAERRLVLNGVEKEHENLKYASMDLMAPFGGYKSSGNGREWGDYAFAEFLETKAILGVAP